MKKFLKFLLGAWLRPGSPPDIFEKSRRDLVAKEKRRVSLRKTPFFETHQPEGISWMIDKCCAISNESRFVYCRIPKAANSTTMATLYNSCHSKVEFSREEMNHLKFRTYQAPSDLSAKETAAASDYFTFTICRDPASRILSAYRDKIMDRAKFHHRCEVARFLGKAIDAEIGFDQFLDFVESRDGLKVNYHWAPQVKLLAVPPEQLSFIGKMENLANDLAFVTRSIFGEGKEIINWSPHATRRESAPSGWRESLSHAQKARISFLYRQDYEVFDYPLPDSK